MPTYIISYYIISYYFISFHMISFHSISYHVILYYTASGFRILKIDTTSSKGNSKLGPTGPMNDASHGSAKERVFARCLEDALIIWHFCAVHSDPTCKLYPTADTATADSTCSSRPPRDSQQLERGEISEARNACPGFCQARCTRFGFK